MKHFLTSLNRTIVSAIIILLTFTTSLVYADGEVNVYNWAEYIGKPPFKTSKRNFLSKLPTTIMTR